MDDVYWSPVDSDSEVNNTEWNKKWVYWYIVQRLDDVSLSIIKECQDGDGNWHIDRKALCTGWAMEAVCRRLINMRHLFDPF